MDVKKMLNAVGKEASKRSPEILTSLAIVGLISTVVATYKAGIKASDILKERKKDLDLVKKGDKEARKAVNMECAKRLAPTLIAPVVLGVATGGCIFGSHSVSSRRIAALSAAYSLAESSVKQLNGKMQEVLGEQKTRQIKDSIMKDDLKKDGADPKEENVIVTGDGTCLCKDLYSGRYFRSNFQKIRNAVSKLSYELLNDMYISLNDFYFEIGLPNIPMGNDLGWNIDDTNKGQLPITCTAILTEDGTPCICVEYDVSVRDDFRRLM